MQRNFYGENMDYIMSIDSFITAAKQNNKALIEQYLKNGFNINERDAYGFTALLEAAEFGHKELFWYLIENKADISIKAEGGFSIVHAIGLGGDKNMLDYIEKNGISLTEIVTDGEQKGLGIKDYAIMGKNTEIINALQNRLL